MQPYSIDDFKDSSTASVATDVNGLIDDVLPEIFRRLPAKTLFRCKCVSKTWSHLISVICSQKLYNVPFGLLQIHSPIDMYFQVYDFLSSDLDICFETYAIIYSVCNGMIICQTVPQVSLPLPICIVNPLTKSKVVIPLKPQPLMPLYGSTLMLVLDYRVSPHYKVIEYGNGGILRDGPNVKTKVSIFSSETGKWRDLIVPYDGFFSEDWKEYVICLNGVAYKLGLCHVLAFHMEEERFEVIKLPLEGNWLLAQTTLGECRGSVYWAFRDNNSLTIWAMKGSSSGIWELKHEITLEDFRDKVHQSCGSVPSFGRLRSQYPLAFHPEYEIVYIQWSNFIYAYHFNESRVKLFGVLYIAKAVYCIFHPFQACVDEPLGFAYNVFNMPPINFSRADREKAN